MSFVGLTWIEPETCEDWDLIKCNHKKEFYDEREALAHMERHKIKGKPFYWQPTIWKEKKVVVQNEHWIPVKSGKEVSASE